MTDFGQDLLIALSSREGTEQATITALLLLLNALHIAEPEPNQTQILRTLSDGAMADGQLLKTLSGLPAYRKLRRSVGASGKIKNATQPTNAGIQARTTLRGLALLFQSERCALAASPRPRHRFDLVNGYIADRGQLRKYESLAKETHRWRKKFTGTGLIGDAVKMRDFIRAVLVAMLGPTAPALLKTPYDPATISQFRKAGVEVHDRLAGQIPDALLRDVLCALFDFSLHDDAEISMTIANLVDAPALSLDCGEVSAITADMLPQDLFTRGLTLDFGSHIKKKVNTFGVPIRGKD
jgi:hypothetical protein